MPSTDARTRRTGRQVEQEGRFGQPLTGGHATTASSPRLRGAPPAGPRRPHHRVAQVDPAGRAPDLAPARSASAPELGRPVGTPCVGPWLPPRRLQITELRMRGPGSKFTRKAALIEGLESISSTFEQRPIGLRTHLSEPPVKFLENGGFTSPGVRWHLKDPCVTLRKGVSQSNRWFGSSSGLGETRRPPGRQHSINLLTYRRSVHGIPN